MVIIATSSKEFPTVLKLVLHLGAREHKKKPMQLKEPDRWLHFCMTYVNIRVIDMTKPTKSHCEYIEITNK